MLARERLWPEGQASRSGLQEQVWEARVSVSAEGACLLRGNADGAQPVELLLRCRLALCGRHDALLQATEVLVRPRILLAGTSVSTRHYFCAVLDDART